VPILFCRTGLHEHGKLRTVKSRAHHAHAFSIAPIDKPVLDVALYLLRCKRFAFGYYDGAVATVEIDPLKRTVVASPSWLDPMYVQKIWWCIGSMASDRAEPDLRRVDSKERTDPHLSPERGSVRADINERLRSLMAAAADRGEAERSSVSVDTR
jgi:hypothetical protein